MAVQVKSTYFNPTPASPARSPSKIKRILKKTVIFCADMTPRAVFAYWFGLYGLGMCYKHGIMMRIQFKAMEILYPYVGYTGIGALMPKIDWYASKIIQSALTLIGGVIYELIKRVVLAIKNFVFTLQVIQNWQIKKSLPAETSSKLV